VKDPDPQLKMAIWLDVDTPNERLRTLQDLDMGTVVEDARSRDAQAVQIPCDKASRSWKAHNE
jgi:hypothetical protein